MVESYYVPPRHAALDDPAACEYAFATYNRGSGVEKNFHGPSMSVGDVVLLEWTRYARTAFACAPVGFVAIPWEDRFAAMADIEKSEELEER